MSLPQFQTEYKRCVASEFLTALTVESTVFRVVMREVRQKLAEGKHCLRNVGVLLLGYTALYPRRQYSSQHPWFLNDAAELP
jgi:hypothetical protein